jgi:hypothetical protein
VAVGRFAELGALEESGVRITSLALPRTKGQAQQSIALAQQILRFYVREFGPCPYPVLSLAHIEGMTPGGHSPPGLVVLSHRPMLLRGRLQDDPASLSEHPGFFLAHELAHQWWGHGVAGENYRERWLSEGFAQYAALLWLREALGEDAMREALARMERWVRRYAGAGPISLGYRLGRLKQDPKAYRAIVYDKGAYVLHMLRGLVGDEAFKTALGSLLSNHRYSKVGTDDLREALEAAAGRELAPYVEEWVRGTRLPRLQVSHASAAREGGGYRTWVTVQAEGLPGPVPLAIAVDGDGREPRRVTLPPGGGRYEIDTPQRIGRVLVNEDHGLLLGRD